MCIHSMTIVVTNSFKCVLFNSVCKLGSKPLHPTCATHCYSRRASFTLKYFQDLKNLVLFSLCLNSTSIKTIL